ncbi:MAG: hypothetical protein JO021_14955 [Alphaproteobacteria bacterium]|nr:hypothetical protein [Alphaproteobacteria bacterium]
MFGLSFAKLLVLVFVVAVVWFGIRWLNDQTRPRDDVRKPARGPAPSPHPSTAARNAQPATEDLTKCPVCGTYVARGAPRCDRSDCPAALHG